jgi:hypothetical protein
VLCKERHVVALRFTALAVTDVGSAAFYGADGEAVVRMHAQNDAWRKDQIEPWAAEIVRRAQRDGRPVVCSTLYEPRPGWSLAGIASLLDPQTGLEFGQVERLLSGADVGPEMRQWIDEARP